MDWKKQQLIGLNASLQYCAFKSPYYKEKLKNTNLELNTAKDLQNIPCTTKNDIQEQNASFLCVERTHIADFSATTGTLGKPVNVWLTSNDLERLARNEANSFAIAGVQPGTVMQLSTTVNKRFMAGLAYVLGAKKLGAGLIRIGSGVPGMQWDAIQELQPEVLIAVPSFVLRLLDWAKEKNIDFENCSIQKIICIGEPIRDANLELNTLGRKIRDTWKVKLHATYASTEMQTAFTECDYGLGAHIQTELIYAEILDEEGNVITNGTPGELTITTIGVEGMPLIRYKTGDICAMYDTPCACGRPGPRIGPILGRKQQMIKLKGTTLYPPALFNAIESVKGINAYIAEVSGTTFGTDAVKIIISLSNKAENTIFELQETLQSQLRVLPEIVVIPDADMHKLQFPEGARKAIKFIDLRLEI